MARFQGDIGSTVETKFRQELVSKQATDSSPSLLAGPGPLGLADWLERSNMADWLELVH